MAKAKETVEVVESEAKAKETVEVVESEAKAAFRLIIEAYKEANPRKYEAKKEVLEAKLNSL